jgi:TonB family protein
MFNTLESNWDQSARRGWTTVASFTLQTISLSLVVALSVLWMQRPPQVRWLVTAPTFATSNSASPSRPNQRDYKGASTGRALLNPIIPGPSIPLDATRGIDVDVEGAPDFRNIQTDTGGERAPGFLFGSGNGISPVILTHPTVTKPVIVSNLGEGSLIYRVQPNYPELARQARVQGAVELRALISKSGTIENLVVVRGHPMLAAAALDAVRRWRYRPYLLNHEPVEVETEITVNFLLGGGERGVRF